MSRKYSKIVISVIMPAKNVESFIHEAVQSVLAQRSVCFELLIADDASKDKTWEYIKQYQNDPRVRIWKFLKSKGQAGAANFLMKRAKGRYLFFCDADDMILPSSLLTLLTGFKKSPKVGVVYGERLILKKNGKISLERRSRRAWDLLEGSISNGGAMIRRTLLNKTSGYRTDMPYLEDCEFFSRLYEITQFSYLKGKKTYIYRKQRGGITEKFKNKFQSYRLKIFREAILRRYGFRVSW